ncbi:glycosyltransferase [Rhizomicrobium electricum]|uniref:Glycosyltransferase subfamily 4-like N-terminal domain-containing protein n=1 Tax=Rhizomicrobium electricum TaxID=480070 RepID=A0ABN1EYA4_9PROT|nr:glycosyltransferase [Rhizomicrobium electricum]NIJ49845.1 glycosyltransferase involved in cell wall biosynthesis [Rhizomicrobium electricum]
MDRLTLLYFISDEFPTHRPDVTCLFGKYLAREGIGSDLVARGGEAGKTYDWPAGQLFRTPRSPSGIATHFAAFWADVKALARSWRRYDAVLVRDKMLFAPLAQIRARLAGKPFFVWMSFPYAEWSNAAATGRHGIARLVHVLRGRFGAWLTYRLVLPHADAVFVQSDKMLEDIAAQGVPRAVMTAVPMCVDPERFADLSKATPGQTRVIGYLGVFDRMRQVEVLVRALAKLRSDGRNVVLKIVGDSTETAERPWLRELIAALRLDGAVIITGWVSPEAAIARMADVEIALCAMPNDPVFSVGTPTKLVEYLALGKAVVANTQPDHEAVLNESGAGLCVPLTVEGYAGAIAQLLDDAALLASMRAAGRRYVLDRRNYASLAHDLAIQLRRLCGKT